MSADSDQGGQGHQTGTEEGPHAAWKAPWKRSLVSGNELIYPTDPIREARPDGARPTPQVLVLLSKTPSC